MQAWREFDRLMQGSGAGTYPQDLGTPGTFTRWWQGVQRSWRIWQEQHLVAFNAWGRPDRIRSFIPPSGPGSIPYPLLQIVPRNPNTK
jgi:hypothetical protein